MERFEPDRRRAHVLRYGQDPELVVRLRLAHTLWLLGQPDEADRQRDLALAAAARSSHAYSRAVTFLWAANVALDRGEHAELRRHAQALAAYAVEDAPAQVLVPVDLFTGYLDVLDGRTAQGLARVRRVREQVVLGEAPAPGVPGFATRVLLESYAVAHDPGSGLALAEEALGMGRGAELWEPEIRRLRAIFMAALDARDEEVEAELERALTVARRQQARAFEKRIQGTLAERHVGHHRAHR
jgi:hypothetical protein